jgi:hypothetical protein
MASMTAPEVPDRDPIDEEVELLLAHPALRARLEDFERRLAEGRLGPGIPTSEVRRRLGMPPEGSETPPA